MAQRFYKEHVEPAAKSRFGHGGHVPVFVSGVHNADEASCLYRLVSMINELDTSVEDKIPSMEFNFRTITEFTGLLKAEKNSNVYHFYGDIPLSK